MITRKRLKAYAAGSGADARDENDGRFQFLADGFCLTVFPVDNGEEPWVWSITRKKSGLRTGQFIGGLIRPAKPSLPQTGRSHKDDQENG
jgi:hypothetical protein